MADQIIVEDSVGPIDHAVISELATQQGAFPQGLANPVTPPSRGVKRKSGVTGGERGTHGGFKPKSHFTESENVMLVELIIRNRPVLKSRRPEAQVERANAFDSFTEALNEMNPGSPKTVLQVRKKMDNLVSRVKKLIEEHREVGYVKNKIPVYLINLANEFILWNPPGEEVAGGGHIVPAGVHDDFASTASSNAGFTHALHASNGPIQTREGMLRKRKLELECELLLEQIKKVKAENEFTEARFGGVGVLFGRQDLATGELRALQSDPFFPILAENEGVLRSKGKKIDVSFKGLRRKIRHPSVVIVTDCHFARDNFAEILQSVLDERASVGVQVCENELEGCVEIDLRPTVRDLPSIVEDVGK
ncbi:hypothetical protein FOL46_006619 [Perkinsus olseni]|uniref:Myb/SANT-like DNA-binding domain-containing protein n=2 Tax=Perkinsus olseni TaxID=32597 RepID=A0A7J6LKE0_PEROL|nr:hypothetical protein FOL46_006619 [Perkinsus olseni]